MVRSFQNWLSDLPMTDPLRREQAALLQSFLLLLSAGGLAGLLSSLLATAAIDRIVGVSTTITLVVLLLLALVILRRGQFTAAVVLAIISLQLIAMANMVPTGIAGSRAIFILFALPITLAGLVGTGRILALAFGLSGLLVIGVAIMQNVAPTLVGYSPDTYDPLLTAVTFIIGAGLLTLLVGRFGHVLQVALRNARSREHELELLRDSLEHTVSERTTALQQALAEVEQREASLQKTLADLRESQATVRELSAPIIPVLPGVLVAPLTGTLDDSRVASLSEQVLGAIERTRAHDLIFDVTGVPLVDTHVARAILNTAMAARLLGTHTAIVGVRPEVAQTVVSLGIIIEGIVTYPTLQEAIGAMIGRNPAGARANEVDSRPV